MEWENDFIKFSDPIRIYGSGWITHHHHGRKAYCFLKSDILAWVKNHPSSMYTLAQKARENSWIGGDLYFLSDELEAWLLLRWS